MGDRWSAPDHWPLAAATLSRWAAQRWGWSPGQPDWPGGLGLLAVAEADGHTALDWSGVAAWWALRFSQPPEAFGLAPPDQWPPHLWDTWVIRRGDLLQTRRNAALERSLFDALAALADPEAAPAEGQDAAVDRAGRTRLLLLAGGPGTGKTSTLKALIARWTEVRPGLRAVIAAPTGRAAARAKDTFAGAAGAPECVTLHRLLGLRPGLTPPYYGAERRLPFDLVVVDEASMLDLATASALTSALAEGAALVLVGDPGQLPSVEPGAVLADVLAHPRFRGSVVRLRHRYRLKDGGEDLGRVFDWLQGTGDAQTMADALPSLASDAFRWVETPDGADPGATALAEWGHGLPDRILLSPVHEGPGGTKALGMLADRALGRAPGTVDDGLPWMITRNLASLELSNGDRGTVVRTGDRLLFRLPGAADRPFAQVESEGEAAWAVTVHKAQGSEYDKVVLVLPPHDNPNLVRELVYTGLTRARREAVLVGSRASLVRALGRSATRWSGFAGLR